MEVCLINQIPPFHFEFDRVVILSASAMLILTVEQTSAETHEKRYHGQVFEHENSRSGGYLPR
jgi:hypothetical protein